MAVLQAAVRATCMGQTVTATPLTSTGVLWHERQRILDANTAEILRLLQCKVSYSGEQL
ncbi:hypothetical protein [Corynebacterium diphtheriae]|uniref:hypothetical protein n=1 Tax=Corynebacterium diphtheriae TaxID=1717 RepID=UPI000AA1095F|nr:hypothetical protein [Corynebacterium diphtheriae]